MKLLSNYLEYNNSLNSIVCVGAFDGIHLGHNILIDRMMRLKNEYNLTTILFTFNPNPKSFLLNKTDRIFSNEEMIMIYNKINIDYIIIQNFDMEFSEINAHNFVQKILVEVLHCKHLVMGFDNNFGKNGEGNSKFIKNFDEIKTYVIERQEYNEDKISSTNIRQLLKEGKIVEANNLLYTKYFISGKVIKGKQLGRKLGFPTANIEIKDKNKILPKIGVYICEIQIYGKKFCGMMNIGTNPTVDFDKNIKVEINIFDYNNEIYNVEIQIFPLKKIRNEKTFINIDDLQYQLKKDKTIALDYFENRIIL